MGKIKVIHLITRFDKGGSAENTFLTVRGLDKSQYDVLLIHGPSHESAMGEEEQAAVHDNLSEAERAGVRLMTVETLIRNVHPLQDARAFRTLRRIFLSERPQIVHTHTSKAGILGRWAAWLSRTPIIIHTPHGHVFWGYFNRGVSLFYALLERLTACITDKIITLTEQEKKDHLALDIAPEDKFEVIHSGVDLDQFRAVHTHRKESKKAPGVPGDDLIVGAVGRLTEIKGYRFLVEAAPKVLALLPNTSFLLLGDGEQLGDLKRSATALGVQDRFRFLGWQRNVPEIMSSFDIFVHPSLNEGMGKVIVEAMALGKPVVASSVGGILDLVHHGVNGLLIPPADPLALADAMLRLLEHPEERSRLGTKGMETAGRYDAVSMVEKIDHLYRDVMGRKEGIPFAPSNDPETQREG